MAYAQENKKINKCNGELSLHVLDIIQSTMKASITGIPQKLKRNAKCQKNFLMKRLKKY